MEIITYLNTTGLITGLNIEPFLSVYFTHPYILSAGPISARPPYVRVSLLRIPVGHWWKGAGLSKTRQYVEAEVKAYYPRTRAASSSRDPEYIFFLTFSLFSLWWLGGRGPD